MNTQVRVTAIRETGNGSIQSGWFVDVNKGEQYAAAMLNKGYIVRREFR